MAALVLNRVRDRLMMIANDEVVLPAAGQLADFADWPTLYGIAVEQERVFGVELESAAEYDEQDPAGRETLRLGILIKHYPHRTSPLRHQLARLRRDPLAGGRRGWLAGNLSDGDRLR